MTRRQALLSISSLALAPSFATPAPLANRPKLAGTLRQRARSRIEEPPGSGKLRVKNATLDWKVSESAIIICDMWDDHWCKSAARRVGEMAVRMNEVVKAARKLGVMIIHAPSATIDFYADTPYRRRMLEAPHAEPPVPIQSWCHLEPEKEHRLPIDDSDGGCDDANPAESHRAWSRQHATIEIRSHDGVTDQGQEVYNFCRQEGITNLAIMGVHTNMCVLGRSFGIRQMTKVGMNVVLVRDLTDAMYDPRDEPRVSHARGTELVIEHVERYWCPSILSSDLTSVVLGSKPQTTGQRRGRKSTLAAGAKSAVPGASPT